MRPRQVDSNHAVIVGALRSAGVFVWSTAALGGGFPDLVAWYRGAYHLLEVKPPLGPKGGKSHRGLSPAEEAFFAACPGPVHVVRSPEEALQAIGVKVRP